MNKEDLDEYKKKLANLSEEDKKERNNYLQNLAKGKIQGPQVGKASIDKPWSKYYPDGSLNLDVPKMSIYQYFKMNAEKYLDETALDLRMSFNNFKKSVRRLTYREFLEEVVTISCGFKKIGISEEEILLQMLPNFVESRESIYASNAIGTTIYPISPMIPATVMSKIIDSSNIKNVIIYGGFSEKFNDILQSEKIEHIIYLNGLESFSPLLKGIAKITDKTNQLDIPKNPKIITWKTLMEEGKKYRKEHNITTFKDFNGVYKENHIAAICGTSGTTGIPKGACLSDYAINSTDFAERIPHPFEPGEKNLDVLIQSISYGLGIMHHTMCGGLENVIVPELVTDKIASLLKIIQPDHFSGGPIHYENIIKSKEYINNEIKKPKNFLCGGATLNRETERKLNKVTDEKNVDESKIFVRQGLGSTENTGTGVYTTKGSYKFGSVGVPIALTNAGVFKYGTDEELSYGEVGELCTSSPTMMNEYLNNPEETKKVIKIHSDGTRWLHLGDEGYMDKDGNTYLLDRYKNIFMRNGFNVHPNKIAEVINKADFVEKCYVCGVNHPIEMAVPVAFIVLKDNIDREDAIKRLNDLCFVNLDEYYIPYEYIFVKDIPLNLGGKVDEKKLLDDYKIDFTNSNETKTNLR